MGKGTKNGASKSVSHQLFKDRAKNRVDDLQGMLTDLQSARKESRTVDMTVLEEQVNQMLREWKAELNEPSPAHSLQQEGSHGSFSSEIYRLLHIGEEEDDATSALAVPKLESDNKKSGLLIGPVIQEGFTGIQESQQPAIQFVDEYKGSPSGVQDMGVNNMCYNSQLDYQPYELLRDDQTNYLSFNDMVLCGENSMHQIPGVLPNMCPPPSAFLGPKCALWDCPRPAQGCQSYCSNFHAALAMIEGPPGMTPVLRPGGIGLKDGLLFAALTAKAEGKYAGIPECEGAATTKSPWNAPELFDLTVLEGETIREWLFFDKPRRAFESGNRKQRSLPDYCGRGWHESRKQIMNEFGGLKRSYYMDPQPRKDFEWHLYEYEINNCNACALYRLEYKQVVDGKKNAKAKITKATDSVADLQKQMGRLTAEFPFDNKHSSKGRNPKPNPKAGGVAGDGLEPCDYLVDNLSGDYLT